ncbi:hypothetical protein AVEN_216205-1 [Araneus ventricosus]|uniref:Uncharacterized protein n=1 Tax=Araneus ventricosus TaxID=182803 RepID=A0A4Y2CM46_ARAVE|nr:hypothetical protein AVEN_216205-1 [Araneus ventricosus]
MVLIFHPKKNFERRDFLLSKQIETAFSSLNLPRGGRWNFILPCKMLKRCSSARALFIQVYIGVPFPTGPRPRPRERECKQHKPTHIGVVRASVVVQMMIAILPEQSWSLAADFLHLQLHAAC